MEKYTIEYEIANGRTARVYKAVSKQDKHFVAIKCVRDLKNRKLNDLMRNEVEILKRCQNLHIVRMVDFFEQDKEGLLCIVLEYCNGGNLKDHVEKQKGGCLTEKESLGILEQIIDGFKTLSEHNCLHRDFKAENILLHNGVAKIADFGGSVMMNEVEELHKSYFGTQAIFAPERMRCSLYGHKADVYSLGAVFHFMLFGKYPAQGKVSDFKNEKNNGKPLSDLSKVFLYRALESDKTKRICWDEIFQMNLNPLKTIIISRLPSKYNKLGLRHTNIDKLYKKSSMPYKQDKALSMVPAFQRVNSHGPKEKDKEVEKENLHASSSVSQKERILYHELGELYQMRTLYTEEVENVLFRLEFVHMSMALISSEFGKVYFNEDSVLILKRTLEKLTKLLGWVQSRTNIFQLPEEAFRRFAAHEIYNELAKYIRAVIDDIEPHFLIISRSLIDYIREHKLNIVFAEELTKPDICRRLFFNCMLDFCFRLDSLLPYTNKSDSKVRIMLLRFVALELLAERPMLHGELRQLLNEMGSCTLDELERRLARKFEEVASGPIDVRQ